MELNSDTVYDGKLLHETSYPQRNEKHSELTLQATYNEYAQFGKVDFYDARQKIIHETKRSDKVEKAHKWQVKFYLWLLKINGIEGVTAILEYLRLKQTNRIKLEEEDIFKLTEMINQVKSIVMSEICLPVINKPICKSCSYYEFCYVQE